MTNTLDAAAPMKPAPRTHHIFVDFENVRDLNLAVIGSESVHLTLLIGAREAKLGVAVVEKLLAHAQTTQLVRLKSSGRNALDFALAYYLGRAAMADPAGSFHVISKDTGFDPLIEHLNSRNISAARHDGFAALPFGPPPPPKPAAVPASSLSRIVDHLLKNRASRPKRRKTLGSLISSLLPKCSTEAELNALIAKLRRAGHIAVDEKGAVTYLMDKPHASAADDGADIPF